MPEPIADDWPVWRKSMVVARPIGDFENGSDDGILDAAVIRQLLNNFSRTTRVPIFLWNHVDDLDESPPDGWVESLSINERGQLVAEVKLMGAAVALVRRDQIRSASIAWAPNAKDYQGNPIGALLNHVTLTNNPYIKDLPSIAAARAQGGGQLLVCFTALPLKEADVADEKDSEIVRLKDELAALKAQTPDAKVASQLKESQSLLAEKIRENADLTATVVNLKDDVERFKTNPQLEEAVVQLKSQERQLRAEKIRRLIKEGVAAGQFNLSKVGEPKSGYDHSSDEMVLAWFKDSIFKDSLDKLEFALATYERKKIGQTFKAGLPSGNGEVTISTDDEAHLRKLGFDPASVLIGMKHGSNLTEFKEHLPNKEK